MKLVDPHLRSSRPRRRNYAADEAMHPMQIAAYQRMSFAEKLDDLAQLYWAAREAAASGARMRHPEWSEEQIEREVRERMLYGAT